MSAHDHDRFRDDVGAYLLGALEPPELSSVEQHIESCPVCRDDVERLRLAVDVLPRSVEQFAPPPSLKRSLMETVEAEAAERAGESAPAARPARVPLRQRFSGRWTLRPRVALTVAALVIAIAAAAGFGIAQLTSDEGGQGRTLSAQVDQGRVPGGSATLDVQDDGRGLLRVSRFRQLPPGRTYQAWVDRGGKISPQPTFEVGPDGNGAVALPDDLRGVDKVYVSREPQGGSAAPSELPIVQVTL